MPRPRKPTNVLALKGAFKDQPGRGRARANEPQPVVPIGDPPGHLSPEAQACWREIIGLAHVGTLCEGDRLIVEHGAQLLAQLRAGDWLVHPTILMRFEVFLGKLGMTPADRSKVQVIKSGEIKSPLAEFVA